MGGYGSGPQHGKKTTSRCHQLDVRKLHKSGRLTPGQFFGWQWSRNGEPVASIQMRAEVDRVILDYRHQSGGNDWQSLEYPVRLEWTDCNMGGRRVWFRCPANGCGRRVAVLYLGGAGVFACRHCYRLAYACQREAADHRAMRRADNIRERLGWPPGIANPCGGKPRGMHWRTFWRLTAEHDALVGVSVAGTAKRLGLIERRLDGVRAALRRAG